MIARTWARWVAYWDEREDPLPLAWARILLGLCWTYDFAYIGAQDLVLPLFGVGEIGGLSDALMREDTPWFYRLFPGTLGSAYFLYLTMLLSAVCVMVGFCTRWSALVLLVAWAAFVDVISYADRGIDTLSRLTLMLLAVSPAGRTWSIDARIATGSFFGDGQAWPAFVRRLLVFQLVLMYFVAGVSKVGLTWWPMGHFTALYYLLLDPAVAAWDFGFLHDAPFLFFLTQVGSGGTLVYQISYPIVLVIRAGWLGRWARDSGVEWLWIIAGGVFHLALAVTMTLGIFPWAMLALYPVWFAPEQLRRLFGRVLPSRRS